MGNARNIYISFAGMALILFVGGFLVRHSEIGAFAVLVAAFGVGHTLLHTLDERDRRQGRSGG